MENHVKVYNYMHFQGLGSFGAESVPDPLLEGIWHAFGQIWVPIGTPIGSLWASVSASGGTCVACRFRVFFGWFPGPVKISSRAKVEGNYVPSGALNSTTADHQTSN